MSCWEVIEGKYDPVIIKKDNLEQKIEEEKKKQDYKEPRFYGVSNLSEKQRVKRSLAIRVSSQRRYRV
jgi:hypothetical protein